MDSESLLGGEGTTLRGSLEEIKLIGSGGMSQIFRARQPALDRHVVIKKLKEELVANTEARERFRREARALASVLHQNIAHVYDFIEGPRESYILMEYIDGVDLSTVISKLGHLPPVQAAIILHGVAKGVSYIHTHNLVHRDIKPPNIRLNTRGEVKLMDFGIVMDTTHESLTRPGMMVGSPSYLSPEQVLGDPLTHRADIFLLGICLYEMLTGVRPFKEEGGQTVFQRIREANYQDVKTLQPTVPAALVQVVRRCLKRDPNARYDSVKNLVFDLEQFLGPAASTHGETLLLKYLDDEALLTPTVPHSELPEWAGGKPFGGSGRGWAFAVGALVLIGLAGWMGYRWGWESGAREGADVKARFGAPKPLNK